LGTRITAIGPKSQLDRYLHTTEQALDQYKQGKIDHTTAAQAHDEAVALLVEALYSHYVVRMRLLQSFRTPTGDTFVDGEWQ
jgi:hypothetical protein